MELLKWIDGPVWADADPGCVAQILRILVDNALRHSPAGSEITVRVEGAAETPSVTVHDSGPGIGDPDADRVFRRFERGSQTRDDGGFGLGLAIGRELALRMGGDLRLNPRARGGCFVLVLPAARTAALVPEAPHAA